MSIDEDWDKERRVARTRAIKKFDQRVSRNSLRPSFESKAKIERWRHNINSKS